ncbi:MAG: NADPH-dependent glutamate synthase [Eubacteriales bacterium]|nr:NADPH-dependent glutamate synthase [Clostridiales bacterium]MDY3285769.1 NADPH-dependent glutamate synthase [Eubacteriales bacterium]
MPNMNPKKTEMPAQAPDIRAHNFDEVATGYSVEMAMGEAERCLHCKTRPCVEGCPVNVQIPDFIAAIAKGEFEQAYQIIHETNALPAVCGRVCPQETQCESKCVRGIKTEPVGIGRLERFAADWHLAHTEQLPTPAAPNGKKVAIVGAGPAGLSCAGSLAARGFDVTIYEALHVAGGVLMYGIPEFRLPKAIVRREIENLRAMGVHIVTDYVIGRTSTVDELLEEEHYDAIFLGTGAGLPSFMRVPGENLNGVYSANEYLTRINLMGAYRENSPTPIMHAEHVAVVGGGNVAMDAARCALRLGAKSVTIVYRRGEAELPARAEEVHHAKEEGIIFKLLTAPVEVVGEEGWVKGLKCVQMELGEPDASGRRRPVPVEGSEFVVPCDCVIVAIGTTPNPLIRMTTPGLETNKKGCLIVRDESTGLTTRDSIYAGGDAVTGAATVILAMGAGKAAAQAITEQLIG